jgi:uncharacterized membrane protein (DUF485 family)
MASERSGGDVVDRAVLLRDVMRRQASLGFRVSAVFLTILLGLPLVNAYAPQVARARVGGFTLSWLILGVLFYLLTWGLSAWFIGASNKIEDDIAREYGGGANK